ncbi:hypothetical protein BU24DRAFT_459660 [Aaosphaeria arxii CBS 175.79]|uniref:Hemerythrin-like domain-containing protein n=1 Tax=Aaosphaeria arxii CBS 175.79 TaxID=1450172 RepID=A0A6A5Y3C9_9PLEO|nr:uncharacterized protein BU24DRAFT_459660 [Aaosphaeria arxii CBS 175.79]KAF2020045.1 hypothetical protein BU24DRAFT_459660 [Aaosphaeria arxii CBS 175.79]
MASTPPHCPSSAAAENEQPDKPHTTPTASTPPESQEQPLPKLSPADFRAYNHMAEHMDYFHNHFRATWTTLMTACETNKRPKNLSMRQFIGMGLQLCQHLTMHHTIEEKHIFPVLAKKMPAFRKELELLTQHKQIHKGLDRLEEYLLKCQSGESELRLGELKEIMEGFGEVLWQHLDDEVAQLGAENMRKYWSLEEMRRMPM